MPTADDVPEIDWNTHGGEVPRDPALAGIVGKRRKVVGAFPDPNGNRAERREYQRRVRRARG